MNNYNLCIVIPAFNEANKLDVAAYKNFIRLNNEVAIVFINDASSDNTLPLIDNLALGNKSIHIISNEQNAGKAQSVLNGMLYAMDNLASDKYAFLDADLATSLEECVAVSNQINDQVSFCFGSRILTVDSKIERKAYRHYIGRVIATAISKVLKLEVYDTQCGCKVFDKDLAHHIFQEGFISKWLFDVELFFRTMKHYGRAQAIAKMHEYPLKQWIDKGESKVKFSYFFKLWFDLWRIKATYKGV